MNDRQKVALDSLTDVISNIYDQLDRGDIPSMNLPMRSKKNIEFDSRHNVWTYGNLKTARSAKTVQGAVSMLRTAYTTDFINEISGMSGVESAVLVSYNGDYMG